MKNRILIVFLMSLALLAPAYAETDFYGQYQHFRWKEFDDSGAELLEEKGPIFGVGYAGKYYPWRNMLLRPKAEMFAGTVDYDGQTQSGVPLSTETNYIGLKVEGDIGLRAGGKFYVEPFAGLGYRWWNRDIQSTSTASGYDEDWSTLYGRLGLRGTFDIKKDIHIYAEAVAKPAIRNRETAHLSDVGLQDVDLKPGKKTSYYAEAGVRYGMFKAALFYESLRFSKSNSVFATDGVFIYRIWQPESETDIIGLNLGVSF